MSRNPDPFDKDIFKKGIAFVESKSYKNPYLAVNPSSSATGKYQFLWNSLSENNPHILKSMTREQFLKNPDLQERVMDLAIQGGLRKRPSYFRNANDLTKEYSSKIKGWNFRPDEVAALSHFLGRSGARKYLRSLADGKEFSVPGINKDPLEYLKEYNEGSEQNQGSVNLPGTVTQDLSQGQKFRHGGYLKQFADGGPKQNNQMNDLLSEINTGGSHEASPYGGVPIGNGNTAEQGETMTNDYVFSDRITLTEKMLKKYKLPKNLKGKSIARGTEILTKLAKESTNPIDVETAKESLERMKMLNEENKPQEEQGQQFFFGGEKKNQSPSEGMGIDGILGMGSAALNFGSQLFGDTGVDTTGNSSYGKAGVGAQVGGNILQGASAGSALGPLGAIGGGLIGGITGLIGGNKRKNAIEEANFNYSMAQNSKYRQSDFRYGGKKYDDGGRRDPRFNDNLLDNYLRGGRDIDNIDASAFGAGTPEPQKPTFLEGLGRGIGNVFNDVKDFAKSPEGKEKIGNTANDAMRFAPILTNYLQYKNMKKPGFEALDRIDSKYRPDYVDESSLVNQVKEQDGTTRRALKEASGGDLGALRTNLLASHLNSVKGRSSAFMQAENINRQENQVGQQFDQRNDIFNLRQSNLENDINARNQASYDNNRSRFLSSIGEGIGNIGLENMRKKYPERAGLLYDFLGKYLNENQ